MHWPDLIDSDSDSGSGFDSFDHCKILWNKTFDSAEQYCTTDARRKGGTTPFLSRGPTRPDIPLLSLISRILPAVNHSTLRPTSKPPPP